MNKKPNYAAYYEFCNSDAQRITLEYLDKYTQKEAAEKLGKSTGTVSNTWDRIKKNAAKRGYAPEFGLNQTVAPGQTLKGTSTLYKDGQPVIQWVKTNADQEAQLELMREAINALKEDLPVYLPVELQTNGLSNPQLLNHITLTDTHIGDWASKETSGDVWNLEEAERVIYGVVEGLVKESPCASTAILSLLGDICHYDSALVAETPRSRNQLDSSGTLQTIVPVVIKVLRRVITLLLQTHNKLVISIVRGNHDEASTIWLKSFLVAVYENEPRIEFIEGDLFYQVYQEQNLMLGFHHGDRRKPEELPLIFATRYPEQWGLTKKRYFHSGDKHHKMTKDVQGNQVIQHATLDAKNRYSSNNGYDSERMAERYTYDFKHGLISVGNYSVDRLG